MEVVARVTPVVEQINNCCAFPSVEPFSRSRWRHRSAMRRRMRPRVTPFRMKEFAPNGIHATLSKWFRAYSVCPPAHEFPLFQVIRILPNPGERSKSPRSTGVNLKNSFQRLWATECMKDEAKTTVDAFMKEFEKTVRSKPPAQVITDMFTVSEGSLLQAGINISSGSSTKDSRATRMMRQLQLQEHYSESYQGGLRLQRLMWSNASLVFRLILEELYSDDFPAASSDRALIGVVTSRTVSTIGVSKSYEPTSGSLSFVHGRKKRHSQNQGCTLSGVSALRFIVFPIERMEESKWRIYRGINVCDSDIDVDDESFTPETRNADEFYRAKRWVLGKGDLLHGSNYDTLEHVQISRRDG